MCNLRIVLDRKHLFKKYRFPMMLALVTVLLCINIWSFTIMINNNKSDATDKKIAEQADTNGNVLGAKSKISSLPTHSPKYTPTLAQSPTAAITPVESNINLGIVVDDYANKTGALSSIQETLGKNLSYVSIFKQFGLPTNNLLNLDDVSYIKGHNIKLLIAWEPWDPREQMHQSKDYLKEVADGNQDSYIKDFARSVKAYGAPVTIRFGHEMNGDWYPWGKRPTEYINAYRRVVLMFRSEGVQNVAWMWSVNASPISGISAYYPGNDYVDVIGMDGFNFGNTQSASTWVSFKQIFYPSYNTLLSLFSKPLVISETASAESGGSKAQWINEMFYDLAHYMPKIHEIIWFDLIKETDWRIDSSPSSLKSFQQNL